MPSERDAVVSVVVNQSSGRGRGAEAVSRLAAVLRHSGFESDFCDISRIGHGWAPRGRCVVAVGGDGTVRAVAARLAGGNVPLAVVPAGTENLAARALGFRVRTERLASALRAGVVRYIDLGVIRRSRHPDHRFVIMASAGFDADVVHALDALRRGPISHASYLRPIGAVARRWRGPEVTIARDGSVCRATWCGGVVVANAPEYALRLNPARVADPEDGLLDAVALRCRTAIGAAGWMGRLLVGGPGPAASMGRDRSWQLRWDRPVPLQADGDPVPGGPCTSAEVAVMPGVLPVVDLRSPP
jgi:diacylglycerol kinase (ATP)